MSGIRQYVRKDRTITWAAALVAALCLALAAVAPSAKAAEVIRSFSATYTIAPSGVITVEEVIAWDFGTEQRHGIFRDLIDRQACPSEVAADRTYGCPSGSDRRYEYSITSVERASAQTGQLTYQPEPYEVSTEGDGKRMKIGDADRFVSGRQSYRIRYTLTGALDAYTDHDELYWNATGIWPQAIESVAITVTLPAARSVEATCFQGTGTQACSSAVSGPAATYRTTRTLSAGEQLTVAMKWAKGTVVVAAPITEDRVSIDDFFALDAWEFAGMALAGLLSVGGVIVLWWRNGRDRRYRTLYYLTNDPTEETKPLRGRTDVVVEFLPPDDLRPAEMGLILDERADPLDVTATIIDLAVRGYLKITEIPKEGLFGKKDWKLTQVKEGGSELRPYEATILNGVFKSGNEVELSDLKNTFMATLSKAQSQLYDGGAERRWFARSPESARNLWLGAGIGLVVAGAALTVGCGWLLGRALIGAPVVVAGVLLLILSRSMARRTATGSEALRRVLGFRLYVATAETRMQEFNEQQNIFARYLPYAIVFGCVDKWAKAFEGMEGQAAASTASWYTGVGAFHVLAFSSSLQGFSTNMTSTIHSSPSSSGSGFSGGGFSGGGGGGGGGGSW